MNRTLERAVLIADRIRHSPKYNRRFRVGGILVTRNGTYIHLVSKKNGRVYNF